MKLKKKDQAQTALNKADDLLSDPKVSNDFRLMLSSSHDLNVNFMFSSSPYLIVPTDNGDTYDGRNDEEYIRVLTDVTIPAIEKELE